MTNTIAQIKARKVQSNHRNAALPRAFPGMFLNVEAQIFAAASKYSEHYNGGFWEFYRLDNGGFYMAPDIDNLKWENAANYGQGFMTGDAYGIAVCLMVYSLLAGAYDFRGESHKAETMARHFHALRDYALQHSHSAEILAMID